MQVDSVLEAEKRRLQADKTLEEECINIEKELTNKSMLFYNKLEKDDRDMTMKVYFLSKSNEFPSRELIKTVDTYVWISDNYFVYSIEGEGIYRFDVITGENIPLIERSGSPFKIESFMNDVITYDGKELVLEF